MSKLTEAQIRAIKKYEAKNCVRLSMKLNKVTDADILERLEEVESKQGYVKDLIREDIRKGR